MLLVGASVVGSLVPDLDIPESSASGFISPVNRRFIGWVLNALVLILAAYGLVNRNNTFIVSLVIPAVLLLLLGRASLVPKLLHIARHIWQGILIIGCIYMYIRTQELPTLLWASLLLIYFLSWHRGPSHTVILSAATAAVVGYSVNVFQGETLAVYAGMFFFLGACSHLAADFITNRGIPAPWWPLDAIIRAICRRRRKGILQDLRQRVHAPITFPTGAAWEALIWGGCLLVFITSLRR